MAAIDEQKGPESALLGIGLHDPASALRLLGDLAGNGVTDDDVAPLIPLLLASLRASPDPDRSLSSFARWFASVGNPLSHLQTLLAHPVALELFCLITGCSQVFADLLVRNPEYFETIANRGVRGGTKTAARFQREAAAIVGACLRPELKRDVLRRWKAREMLRIGVRDLAGLADMPSTAREFSNLADACVQQALEIALASVPRVQAFGIGQSALVAGEGRVEDFDAGVQPPESNAECRMPIALSVIAMGKLGGQELNYSSDIDLMFVLADDLPEQLTLENGRRMETVTRVAETVVKTLSEETSSGHVFRVDMRLRPEGRFGPLARTLSSYRAYYENWAEPWERQALLKARPVGGDAELGRAFMEMITPLVYRPVVSEEFIHAVRANKRRIEQKCALEGETETNVKTGYGGIRDIEFIVQLFQLELGGMHSQVRSANTLSGIQRLRHLSVLTRSEARELSQDYQYLRTLEHRLQLLHGSQTQTMPAAQDDQERTFLAMRMGFSDRGAFEADLAARRHRVRHYLDRLFYGERRPSEHASLSASADWSDVGDLLDNQHSQAAEDQLASRLAAAGFMDVPAALRALRLPMSGNEFGGMPPDTPEEFKTIAPRLLALLAASAQPDQALAGLEALALAVPNRAQLYASMDDSPEIMDRLVALAAASPPLMRLLTQHLEWMESIVGDEDEDEQEQLQGVTPGQNSHVEGLGERLRAARGREQKLEALARYYLRERLRIGARDAWDRDAPVETMTALTRLAEAVLSALMAMEAEALIATEAAPELAREALPHVSAVGLGKLGGAELGYASDWDLVFVYDEGDGRTDGRGEHRSALAQRLVESIHSAARLIGTYGADIELDLRLRPWGKKGALALTPSAYREYLDAAGETWERQAGLKARYVAGDESPGRRMEEIFRAASVGRAATPEELAEIVAMKRRIERERLNAAEQETDLKLGFGGMSDVEWLVQKLQIQHGKSRPSLWETNTLRALRALAAESVLSEQEAIVLEEAYTLLTRLRNGLWLLTGRSEDVLADAAHRRALARRRGYADAEESRAEEQLWATVRAKMGEVRAIFEARFAGE